MKKIMKKNRNIMYVWAILFLCSTIFSVLFFSLKEFPFSLLSSEDSLSILIEQFASAFLIISVLAVLSDKSNVVLWENLVHLKLVEPAGFNLIDLSVYTFYILLLSVISYIGQRYLLMSILAVIEVLILTYMVFRVLQVYFNNDSIKKSLKVKFFKGNEEYKYEKLEILYYRTMEKLNNFDFKNLDNDIAFFLIGAEETGNRQLGNMAESLIRQTAATNSYMVSKIFSKQQEHFSSPSCIEGEYEKYIQVRNKYLHIICLKYPEIFKNIQHEINHDWIDVYLKKITFSQRNYDKNTDLQYATYSLLKTAALNQFLDQYGGCPVLVERCLTYINKLLLEEMKVRGCGGVQCNLTFRNNSLFICLVSDSVYCKWMEILDQYKSLYPNALEPDREVLKNCIMGIIWIQYMQLKKIIAEKDFFTQNTLNCLEAEPDLAEALYENYCWYKEKIYTPELISCKTVEEDVSEEEYYNMLDEIPDVEIPDEDMVDEDIPD